MPSAIVETCPALGAAASKPWPSSATSQQRPRSRAIRTDLTGMSSTALCVASEEEIEIPRSGGEQTRDKLSGVSIRNRCPVFGERRREMRSRATGFRSSARVDRSYDLTIARRDPARSARSMSDADRDPPIDALARLPEHGNLEAPRPSSWRSAAIWVRSVPLHECQPRRAAGERPLERAAVRRMTRTPKRRGDREPAVADLSGAGGSMLDLEPIPA